jgi:general secretion pathway protein I
MMPSTVSKTKQLGLTLIEVLIALAIISIAMTAIIKATSQTIRGTQYLQTKMTALWVGQTIMNEVLIGIRKLPNPPDQLKEAVTMLNHDWFVVANLTTTPNNRIKQVNVQVYEQETEGDHTPSIIRLESYVYDAQV